MTDGEEDEVDEDDDDDNEEVVDAVEEESDIAGEAVLFVLEVLVGLSGGASFESSSDAGGSLRF